MEITRYVSECAIKMLENRGIDIHKLIKLSDAERDWSDGRTGIYNRKYKIKIIIPDIKDETK